MCSLALYHRAWAVAIFSPGVATAHPGPTTEDLRPAPGGYETLTLVSLPLPAGEGRGEGFPVVGRERSTLFQSTVSFLPLTIEQMCDIMVLYGDCSPASAIALFTNPSAPLTSPGRLPQAARTLISMPHPLPCENKKFSGNN